MGRFLPPAALQAELARASKHLDTATAEHEKAVVALVRAQALVDHSRNGAAAKQAARDAASGHKADVELEMQAAKYFAEYFASAWERKEAEVAAAAAALHRSEVELKQANSAAEAVRKQTAGVVEAKEDADSLLAAASTTYERIKRKVDEAEAKAREAAERQEREETERREAEARALQAAAAAAAAKAAAASGGGAIEAAAVLVAGLMAPVGQSFPEVPTAPALVPAPALAAADGGAAPAAPAPADSDQDGSKRSRSRSRSRSRDRRKQRRRSRSKSRSRSRDRERRRSGKARSKSRSRSRDRERRRSGKDRSRSRSRDRRRSGGSKRSERRDSSPVGRSSRGARGRSRSPTQQNGKEQQKQEPPRRRSSRSPGGQKSPRLANIRVPRGLQRQFEDALRSCLESKPLPFNVSFINDRMKRQEPRWNAQSELGCSFSQMCQVMQRDGLLQLKRQGDTWEVASSKLEQQVRPRRSPPDAAERAGTAGERWIMG